MNHVPSKPQIAALLASLSHCRVNISKVLASHYYTQQFFENRKDTIDSQSPFSNVRIVHWVETPRKHQCVLGHNSPTSKALLGGGCQSLISHQSSYHTLHSGSQLQGVSEKVKANGCCNYNIVRHKSKKKRQDSDNESDSDADDNLDEDDFEAPTQFKVQTIHTPSLRVDAVLSKALGLSRHRLEEIFFGPGILLNGKKVLKKGGKMDEGDYVDAIMEKNNDEIRVKRVKLLKVDSEKTGTDKFTIRVRIWKSPFAIDNPDQWKPNS